MKLLIIFIFANALNIILQTLHSICVVKCSKTVAGLVNACAFGFYTYIIILTTADLPLLLKCGIVAILNFICTFAVKWVEEKIRKDKLWKVEGWFENSDIFDINGDIQKMKNKIYGKFWDCNIIPLADGFKIDFYCENQKATNEAVKFIKENYGKVIFASECAPIIK